MAKLNKKTSKTVWLSALLLFICVCASAAAVVGILDNYQMDDSGAIPLVSEVSAVSREDLPAITPVDESADSGYTVPNLPSGNGGPDTNSDRHESDTVSDSRPLAGAQTKAPSKGLESSDEDLVWSTETEVDLFRTEYANDNGEITVRSANGEKVIAPGTKNSYIFKLKNTGYSNLDYTVDVSAVFATSNEEIPIEVRLSRYDGKWVVGDEATFIPVQDLQHVEDSATLGVGKFTYYTLDWEWPFESDAAGDIQDTSFGSVTLTQDISFSLMIETTASPSTDNPAGPGGGGDGLEAPKTGDDFNTVLWSALAIASAVNLIILILVRRRDDEKEEARA